MIEMAMATTRPLALSFIGQGVDNIKGEVLAA